MRWTTAISVTTPHRTPYSLFKSFEYLHWCTQNTLKKELFFLLDSQFFQIHLYIPDHHEKTVYLKKKKGKTVYRQPSICICSPVFVCFKQLVVWWVFWTCDRQSVVDMLPQPRPVSHWTFSLIKMKFLFSSSQFLMDWFYWSTGRRETRYRKKVKVGRAVQEGAVVTSIVFSLLISFISAIF